MPPPSSRDCPALEPALPSDLPPGGIVLHDPAQVRFGDRRWHDVVIVQEWCRDGRRYIVQLSWHVPGDTVSGEFLYDEDKFR